MGFVKSGVSALGKLLVVAALAATFVAGLVGVVYLSLRGEEVKVPEVVGKDFYESEKEMAGLGLKIKRRATRFSEEKPNTVLEQLPKPGETVKTGQTILVVLSETNPEGGEAPATIKKENVNTSSEEDAGTDIAPDKNVKTNKNSNTKKPAQTTRDVIVNKTTKPTNSNTASAKTNSNETNKNAGNKNASAAPANKTPADTSVPKPAPTKAAPAAPTAAKTPVSGSGETRTRRVP